MSKPLDFRKLSCKQCQENTILDFDFTMAFQPIVSTRQKVAVGHEALVRGLGNESAFSVLSRVNADNRYRFDQLCRVKAISLASTLNMQTYLSINFLPNAIYRPELCIRTTLEAAENYGFPVERICFELVESEHVSDSQHLLSIMSYYKRTQFKVAIDDFGAGFSGLNLLADIQPDILKFDRELIRNVDTDSRRRKIIYHQVNMCRDLGIEPLAEGVETREELDVLMDMGVDLMQGYWFAKPAFESLPAIPAEKFL
ncbi:EAL domain-containing protein [Ketobacter sp.]|uniref:EAL domain-containing protein n=1 Tax=Ketobacter sp. TaxID=2083498 RepID=UPI000F258773|nr:EAL domain-containing protein [Ketobacter sp.]RLT97014.1 MAG: EAL domain-containing protein [Ketobacter sp.]